MELVEAAHVVERDVSDRLDQLFHRLFDDAAIFPPGSLPLADAVPAHARHRTAWYAPTIGPLVCGVAALPALNLLASSPLDVALVVGGAAALPDAMTALDAASHLRLVAIEVRLDDADPADLRRALGSYAGVPAYAEVPVARVDAACVERLRAAGLSLKLRTGGTSAVAFPSEAELAEALRAVVAGDLSFKCTAGLHNAVRHRDPLTGFEHHGFLNVLLAVHACQGGHDPLPTLATIDGPELAERAAALFDADATAVRAAFRSFGTCSLEEPVADLVALGLLAAPVAAEAR